MSALSRLAGVAEVHWAHAGPADLERAPRWLDREELERLARFRSASAAQAYAAAHGLLRRVLSSLIPLEPRAWRFVLGPDGRPDIDPQTPGLPPEGRALSCNLAHTRGLVAVAVSTVPATGVDAEFRGRRTDLARLARAKFAPAEVQRLGREVEGEAFRRRFFRYWTLKESYLKARGTGLRLPLDGFAFDVEPDRPIAVSIAAQLEDDGAAWQFAVADVEPQHSLALALRRGIGQPDLGVRWLGPGV